MQNIKILVVDDDPVVTELLSEALKSKGYAVETASNGAEALEKYRADPNIGLIVSDMNMPEMNGAELIKELRKTKFDVPVIVLTGSNEISLAIDAMHSGANDYLLKDENIEETILISIKNVLEKKQMKEQNLRLMADLALKNTELGKFNDLLKNTIDKLTQIGTSLSSEKKSHRLLEKIVNEALSLTNGDCGILYILEGSNLNAMIHINKSKNIVAGVQSENPVDIPLVSMDESHVSVYSASHKKVVNIPDVYESREFKFSGAKSYDDAIGYKSISMLVLPMLDIENDVIGVLHLINSIDPESANIVEFSANQIELAQSLASQAAVAITNTRLYKETQALFGSIVEMMATAIDEKSPVTRGHISRVTFLTMVMAKEINNADSGYFKNVNFSEDEIHELRIASLLHDVGKIITPEFVIEKRTKLQTIFDRIELIDARINNIKSGLIIEALNKKCLAIKNGEPPETIRTIKESLERQLLELNADMSLLREANNPEEFMDDRKLDRLKEVAFKRIKLGSRDVPVLKQEEFKMLSIRKGSITPEELQIMQNHAAVTIKMLSKIPFTRKFKNVPVYAGGHHEKLDGSGYPLRLKAPQISLQTRIIALTDFFEALVAADRPYKKTIPFEEALKIMEAAVRDNHIDANLFDLFKDKRVYEKLP